MSNRRLRRLALVAALCAAIGPLPVLAASIPSTSGPTTPPGSGPSGPEAPPTEQTAAGDLGGRASASGPASPPSERVDTIEHISAAAAPAGQVPTSLHQPAAAGAVAGAGAFTTGTGDLAGGDGDVHGETHERDDGHREPNGDTGVSDDAGATGDDHVTGEAGVTDDAGVTGNDGSAAGDEDGDAGTAAAEAPEPRAERPGGAGSAGASTCAAFVGDLLAATEPSRNGLSEHELPDEQIPDQQTPEDETPDDVLDDVAGRGEAALFVASIALVETGYDFTADRGAVSGAYLLSDADWDGHGGYRRAADAPPEVQTARAEALAGALLASGATTAELSALWLHSNSVSADGGHGGPVGAYVAEVAGHASELAAGATLPPLDEPAVADAVAHESTAGTPHDPRCTAARTADGHGGDVTTTTEVTR